MFCALPGEVLNTGSVTGKGRKGLLDYKGHYLMAMPSLEPSFKVNYLNYNIMPFPLRGSQGYASMNE